MSDSKSPSDNLALLATACGGDLAEVKRAIAEAVGAPLRSRSLRKEVSGVPAVATPVRVVQLGKPYIPPTPCYASEVCPTSHWYCAACHRWLIQRVAVEHFNPHHPHHHAFIAWDRKRYRVKTFKKGALGATYGKLVADVTRALELQEEV